MPADAPGSKVDVTRLYGAPARQIDTGGFTVMWSRYAPSTRIARHSHEHASLCVGLAGGYDEELVRTTRRVEVGTALIHPEGEVHANRHDPRETSLLTVELGKEALAAACGISLAFRESWTRHAPASLPRAFLIAGLLEDDSPAGRLAVENGLWELIGELFETGSRQYGMPVWLARTRDQLHQGFADAPSLNSLAQAAGVHPMHLTRSFRGAFGTSIGSFVRKRRVAAALERISWQSDGLAEISLASGFADQSHMTREMRLYTGKSPGFWRRRLNGQFH